MFNWDDLRYFLELSRKGRLIAAAQRLHVDHTTVGRRITALEAALNTRLFDKSPRGYTLTEAGYRLLAYAEGMEAQSITLYQDLSGKNAQLTGTVRLATPEAFGGHFLANHISTFYARHPQIEIELVAESRPMSLSKREADLAVTLGRPDSGRLIAWKLCDYKLQLYGAPAYLDRRPPIRTPDDLADHDFVWYVDDLIQIPELRFLNATIKDANVVFRSTSITAQENAVAGGMGLGLLHAFAAAHDPRLTVVLPGQIEVIREYWLVVHEDLRQVARVDAACQFLTEIAKKQQKLLMGLA